MSSTEGLKAMLLEYSQVNPKKCMRCGKCSGTCPAYDEMEYHPHQFVSMIDRGELAPLLATNSLYYCLSCLACVDKCPRNVNPAYLIEAFRYGAISQKGADRLTPDDIPEKLDEDIPQQALVSAFRKYRK